jgi:prepilin-type N-terminal cleavage/methylation domain-containing protein
MRRGFTLIEFLVAAALAGVVTAAIATTFVRQQRFLSAAQERVEIQNRLREGASILSADLRGASVGELGVQLMTDTAVETFMPVAVSIVCTVAGSAIGLPPQSLVRGNTLTSMTAQPDTGDIPLIYGSPYDYPDSGSWSQFSIAAVATRSASTTCPAASGFTTAADGGAGSTSLVVTLTTPVPATIRPGAPVHLLRRARYSLYRSSDNEWYLGYRRCNARGPSVCGSIQPVSGPYHSYSSSSSGLRLRYFNSGGSEIGESQGSSLARIDLTMRSAPLRFGFPRIASRQIVESLTVSTSPRNRLR